MNLEEGLATLDPALSGDQRTDWMTSQIFSGLVELDSALNVNPLLAKRWQISADGKSYTFWLRDDVFFHRHPALGKDSTRKVTASDFKYSFMRVCKPGSGSSGASFFVRRVVGAAAFREGKSQDIAGIEVLSDSLLRINLTEVFPPFLSLLAMPYCFVVPKEVAENKDFAQKPIGTGAFRFYKWENGRYLVLHKNPHYFEQENGQRLPYMSAVYVQFMPSKLSAFMEFVQGNLDFINDIDNAYRDEILLPGGEISPTYQQKYNILLTPQLATTYIAILQDSSLYADKQHPLLDLEFRQALAMGIDKEALTDFLLNRTATAAQQGFVALPARKFASQRSFAPTYNPQKAREIIGRYKQKRGKLPPLTYHCSSSRAAIGEFLQQEWAKIGLEVKVELAPSKTVRQNGKEGKNQIWQANWIGDYPEAETFLSLFYSASVPPNGNNISRFRNASFDKLYEAANRASQDSLRFRYYEAMDSLVMQHLPVIPLFYDKTFKMTRKNISGLPSNPMNMLSLKRVRKH